MESPEELVAMRQVSGAALLMYWAMPRHSRTRAAHEMMTSMRRPPFWRSSHGPMIGATTAKGAMVSSR